MLLRANKLTKYFGATKIFADLSFTLVSGRKVALVGKNGVGKTTLLNIIAGLDSEFQGEMDSPSGTSIGYLGQEINLPENRTLYEECSSHFASALQIKAQIKEMESLLQKSPEDISIQEKYSKLLYQFDQEDGYNIEFKVKRVLSGLGFNSEDMNRQISTFSGGEQRRGLLAKILLSEANLLLLDEPTNHLDIFAIKWLENFLKDYEGSVFMVSHDRRFIDTLVDEIYEFENGSLDFYKGNYQYYLLEKQNRLEAHEKAYDLQQKKIRNEEDFISRNIAGQKTKQAQSRRKALEKVDRLERLRKEKNWGIGFSRDISTHKNILAANDFSKSFGDKVIIESLSIKIEKGNKIGLVGKNGCGKTSFIKALIDSEPNNNLDKNEHIRTSYFAQGNQDLEESFSLFEIIHEQNPRLTENEIRSYLGWFQFRGDDVFKLVANLSGGEKTRLSLLMNVLKPADFLILDEPTNHLDIKTREILGDALKDFPGTVLVVSHDRNFIDHFANTILLLNNGKGYRFVGDYSENEDNIMQTIKTLDKKRHNRGEIDKKENGSLKKKNLNIYKITKIEEDIASLEQEIDKLSTMLLDEKVYSDYKEYHRVDGELKKMEKKLEDNYQEWEELH